MIETLVIEIVEKIVVVEIETAVIGIVVTETVNEIEKGTVIEKEGIIAMSVRLGAIEAVLVTVTLQVNLVALQPKLAEETLVSAWSA